MLRISLNVRTDTAHSLQQSILSALTIVGGNQLNTEMNARSYGISTCLCIGTQFRTR